MINIRELIASEIIQAHTLVAGVFDRFIAPQYNEAGIEEFKDYISTEKLGERLRTGGLFLVGEIDGDLAGLIEVRNGQHIALLFVKAEHQRQGIARALVDEAVRTCLQVNPDLRKMTVNSSPNAQHAYRRMGFTLASGRTNLRWHPFYADVFGSGEKWVPVMIMQHNEV